MRKRTARFLQTDEAEHYLGTEMEQENSNQMAPVNYLLLLALAITPPLFGTAFTRYEWLKGSVLLLFTGLAAIAWGVSVFRGKKTQWKNAKASALLLGFGVFSVLSLIWTPNAGFGLENALMWLMFSVLSFLFATTQSKTMFENAPIAIGIGVIIASGMSFADLLGVGVFSSIWDAPGAAGAFDSVNQAGTYFFLATSLLLLSFPNATGWRRIFTIASLVVGAAAFGMIASISIIHIALLLALVVAIWMSSKDPSIFIVAGGVVAVIVITFFSIPRPDVTKTISNKLPVVYDEGVKNIGDIKSSKIQNTGFDINRIADGEFGRDFSTLVKDIFSRDFSAILIGEGAGSWWLIQNPTLPKTEFQYYSVRRDSPGLPLFELGLLGIFFLVGFVAMLFLTRRQDGSFRFVAIPVLWMIILAGFFSTLASVLLVLACAVGLYSGDEKDESIFTFNGEGKRGLSSALALAILLSGVGFIGYGAFSGMERFK